MQTVWGRRFQLELILSNACQKFCSESMVMLVHPWPVLSWYRPSFCSCLGATGDVSEGPLHLAWTNTDAFLLRFDRSALRLRNASRAGVEIWAPVPGAPLVSSFPLASCKLGDKFAVYTLPGISARIVV